MNARIFRHNLKRMTAGVLAVWLSGFVLLFCCENLRAQGAGDDCPLAHDHCRRRGEKVSQTDSIEANQTTKCCEVLPQIFDKARKVEIVPQIAEAAAQIKLSPARFSFVAPRVGIPKIYKASVRNRGGTYLKNCVFRI